MTGFTLIELLIVILIISIISSVAVLSIRFNEKKNFEAFANQLANRFRLAAEEAMLRPATLGFAATRNAYSFYEFQPIKKNWRPLTDKTLGRHDNNIPLEIHVHGKNLVLDGKPQIIFSESGDITPFIIFIGKDQEYKVVGRANGEIKVE